MDIPEFSGEKVQYSMDRRGILRGKCLLEDCDCSQYELPADSETHYCSYCGHLPTKHLDVQTAESEKDDKEPEAQQLTGTSVLGCKRPTTSQPDEMAKKIPKKSNNENEECIQVEVIQKGPIAVGYGGTIKINAHIISNSIGSLQVNWQKTHNNCSTTLIINRFKYSGSSCDVNNPQLVINNVDKEDAGIYNVEVISPTEIKSSPGILLELYGDEADSLSKEKNNFFRLYFLNQKIATQAVQLFFDSKVLDSFLKQHKSSLTSQSSRYRCTKDQEAKLFPGGHVVVASADFDLSLLYNLIRNLLTAIPAPTCGWGNQPLPGHLTETDDIERIQHLGNNLAQNFDFKICDRDFSTQWTDLSQAIDRLSRGSLSTDVESMRTKKLEKMEEDIREYLKKIPEHIPLNIRNEAEALSKEGNNFFRLYLLTHKIATQAVRVFFDSKVLVSFLKQHKSSLTSKGSRYICTKDQEVKLFPGGHVAVVSTDFDITLLYKLIRNILTAIPAPTCGWGSQPLPGHLNEADDIERIRHLRNNLAHNSEFEICDTDFSTHWTDLSQAIDRLSKGSLSTDVESMRTKSFDKCIKNEMEEDIRKDLKEIREEFTELQKQVVNNRHEIHNINTRNIPLNVQKGHIELIKNWRLEDKLFYDETVGFTAALKMIQSKNYMTIIGGPGSGKTATARHIALQLEEQGWEVVPVCRLDEIIQYGDRDHKQVFVLDDVLGIFAVDMNIYNHFISHKEPIFKAIGGTSKLLFTCRKSVYKEAFELGLFVTENVVDLQSKDNQLTETEKMAICKYHCKSKGVNPDRYASLSFTKANHMFPYLSKLFSLEEQYQHLGESFFNKPFKYFISDLDKLQRTNTIQYAALVLCLINDKLSIELLPHKDMQKEVFNNCGVNRGTPEKQLKDAIYHMSETYFTKLETEYTFTHDFIFEAIAYHYGRQNKHQILKYLSSSYIANKVTVYEQVSNEDLCIHISEDMYLPLAERLYKDIQSMNLFDVFMNKSLLHGPFRDVFEGMLKTKPFDEFESLILRKQENIHQKTLSFNKRIQKQSDITERRRLFLLFDEVCDVKSDSEHSVRVISWIINYGHTHLLQELVNHVECNNNSISLIFGSNVMENTRLLVLGCFSNNLDMVELILKYVDPKCINMDLMSRGTCSYIDSHREDTPLTVACETGNLCIVEALLRNNADINKCNRSEQSPLLIASWYGHSDVVKCLLSSGADVNLRNKDGQSPLCRASWYGRCDVIKCLLSFGADVNLRDQQGLSPLLIASQHGHCDVIKCLISSGADINLCKKGGQSPLLVASEEGYCDVVKCLLSSGADSNLRCYRGRSPLFVAYEKGHCDVVKCLLSSGADINLRDEREQSPLFAASMSGRCDIVKCLLSSGADINLRDEQGQSTLFTASEEGKSDVIKCLLSFGADINLCDNRGHSPLFPASRRGHYDVVNCLLSSGADVNLCDNQGHSPLYIASEEGECDVIKCLLSFGADINLCDNLGQSPLFIASMSGHCDVVKCLLSSGADINLCDECGRSPLFAASWNGECDVVKCLLSAGAYINLCDKQGQSPLFIASLSGQCDVVKCLLSSGADINLCDQLGRPPLFAASFKGHCDVVKCLLSSGADVNLRNNLGQSPLFIASMSGYPGVVNCLCSSGAEINLCDEDGESPLFVASKHGHCDVVKCLRQFSADDKLCNNLGQSSLFIASMSGHCGVVNCLCSSGADINLCDDHRQSPLFIASFKGECDVVKCLLRSGAKINLCDDHGQSPLFIASFKGHCDVVKCLLSSDAEINLCDENGLSLLYAGSRYAQCNVVNCLFSYGLDFYFRYEHEHEQSPLLLVSKSGHRHVKVLLSSGADLNVCDEHETFLFDWIGRILPNYGADINLSNECRQSPLFIASKYGRCDVVKCLLSSGADINLCDDDGQTPWFVATSSGYIDIATLLTVHGALH